MKCLREVREGVEVIAHIQPRASRTEVSGLHGDALKVRVTAPPADGRANEAVCRLLADLFGVAGSWVTLSSGAASRDKRFIIRGVTLGQADARLREVVR